MKAKIGYHTGARRKPKPYWYKGPPLKPEWESQLNQFQLHTLPTVFARRIVCCHTRQIRTLSYTYHTAEGTADSWRASRRRDVPSAQSTGAFYARIRGSVFSFQFVHVGIAANDVRGTNILEYSLSSRMKTHRRNHDEASEVGMGANVTRGTQVLEYFVCSWLNLYREIHDSSYLVYNVCSQAFQ